MRRDVPIPGRLNLAIAALQLVALASILWGAGQVHDWKQVALLSLAYGIVMNSGYALLHEAEHNLLYPNAVVNQAVGALLALFFPAPFHLIRQGHIGHHVRNRSDDEAFDLYFEDGTNIGTTTNIMTLLNSTQIDITPGRVVVDLSAIVNLANGAYIDTKKNIMTLADGTKIDTVTGLKITV